VFHSFFNFFSVLRTNIIEATVDGGPAKTSATADATGNFCTAVPDAAIPLTTAFFRLGFKSLQTPSRPYAKPPIRTSATIGAAAEGVRRRSLA
jgi:hypothetical protein